MEGNRSFGLLHPGHKKISHGNHTYIGTTIRGGLNPGRDEFGGEDVNDVINLVKYLPTLQSTIQNIHLSNKLYLVGESRGAMQMLLALSRSNWLQNKIEKAVSIVGLLDMNETLDKRPDMLSMFYQNFQLNRFNKEKWINQRDPLQAINKIRNDLPILIIQGNEDIRVDLSEGLNMYNKLKSLKYPIEYWEIEGAGHTLNIFDTKLENWLEKPSK